MCQVVDTDFSPKCGSYSEAVLAPLNCGPGAPEKHCFRQLPTDERAFVEVQVPSTKVLTGCWRKKTKTYAHTHLDTLEKLVSKDWRGQLLFQM